MADRYIDETYIKACVGGGYYDAVVAVTSVSVGVMIEGATALIQGYMRNSGYACPSTQDPDDVEVLVKLGTMGAFREMFASVPEKAIKLPENWASHPEKVAYVGIVSGEAKLADEPSQEGAVGGMIFTSSDSSVYISASDTMSLQPSSVQASRTLDASCSVGLVEPE